ncbi:MAG: diaminopimelate decarboxylase [Candidatus Latescibacterota bacterium]|jgi:diaminopimelate decarboxylase
MSSKDQEVEMEQLSFLSVDQVREIRREFGSPVYVYDQKTLETQADSVLGFPNAFGLTARYAMKALPNAAVIRILTQRGLHIDASSGYEAERAMRAGVPADHIQVTAQQIPDNLKALVEKGVIYNACSLNQLRTFGDLFPGHSLSVRINPGAGSGHSNRTNVGGPAASFGIWHEHIDEVHKICGERNLIVTAMHTHIGSGSDPEVWERVALMSLDICVGFPDTHTLSLGGGYKVGRMKGEVSTDLQVIGSHVVEAFRMTAGKSGRELRLEVEPGTYLVANAGAIVTTAMDIVDTGKEGYRFIKIDSGMTETVRPSMYGAQHPIVVVPAEAEARGVGDYLVVGHCCESGDVLTPAPDDPEGLLPRELTEAKVGDAVVIGGAGAYCAGMASKNYNSFPEATEVLIDRDGNAHLVRKRQTLDQVLVNEVVPEFLR